MTEAEIAQIEAEVMAQTDGMLVAWNARDWNATLRFHHPEKTAFAWSGTVYDYDGLMARWETVGENFTAQNSTWNNRKIEVLSKEAAIFQGSFDLRVTRTDGTELYYPGNCVWTALFEPFNGEWLMTYIGYNWGGYEVVE